MKGKCAYDFLFLYKWNAKSLLKCCILLDIPHLYNICDVTVSILLSFAILVDLFSEQAAVELDSKVLRFLDYIIPIGLLDDILCLSSRPFHLPPDWY